MDKKKKPLTPPLAGWVGGKSRLAKSIIERIPPHTCYVEPFAGAAWVLFKKEPSRVEVLNDINGDIVNTYRVIKHHPYELARQFEQSLISRAEFTRLKATPPEVLTDIQRAARFLYLLRASFAGRLEGNFGYNTNTPHRAAADVLQRKSSEAFGRLAPVTIENLPYADCITRYDRGHTFFYLDPPYYNCEGDYGAGIFGKEDFTALADILSRIKGKFLLSINDRPEVRDIFSRFNLEEVSTTYSISGATQPAAELFVSNY